MEWTNAQKKAILDRDKSILVSAAAGSGKTAVLVERIKQLILRDGCPIDRMLIVTFTNAAASEMKAKIEKAILAEIERLSSEEGSEAAEKAAGLRRQLDLIPLAQISTFHSFAMEVVRRFFFTIGCEPNFKICDETNKAILQEKAMTRLFEERYLKGEPEFYDFMNKYGGARRDDRVKSMIYAVSSGLEAMPKPYEWLDEKTEALNVSPGSLDDTPLMKGITEDSERVLALCRKALDENLIAARKAGLTKGTEIPVSDAEKLDSLSEAFSKGSYSKAAAALGDFALMRLSAGYYSVKNNPGLTESELAEIKAFTESRRNLVKKQIKKLRDDLFSMSEEGIEKELRESRKYVAYLGDMVKDFIAYYDEEKAKKGLMDFSDLEHKAFEILENEEAAGYYREHFRYIFVDEYQDSNVLQEALIERISTEGSLFTVGDVKQSIYKFRLAEPEIFQRRYALYRQEADKEGEKATSEKIDLNRNFRSKESVISFVNEIFTETMDEYGEEEALYPGDPFAKEMNYEPALYLINESWSGDDDIDEAVKELKKTEKEALLTVELIRRYLGKPIFDSEKGVERPLSKRDIVILMRGIKNRGDIFYKVLMENGIPCFVDDNKGYFDTIEINTFKSLLDIIDNRKQDIPLLTVMRSEIMGFSLDEMAGIRASHKEGMYYDSLCAYAETGSDEGLKAKCADTLKKLEDWRAMAAAMPLEELIWTLMVDTGFYSAMGAMPGGALRQANLRLLADKAADYAKNRGPGLYGFIKYVEHIKKKDLSVGQARVVSEDEDNVRIMTVHHSKGLEFPMVILSGYTRRLGGNAAENPMKMHKDLGIALPMADHGNFCYKETTLQTLIKRKSLYEEYQEEKRVLYVALTRAKDILLLTGTVRNTDGEAERIRDAFPGENSYYDMTGKIIARNMSRIKTVRDGELSRIAGLRKRSVRNALDFLDSSAEKPDRETERRMTYEYPYRRELDIKSKYTVSELNRRSEAHAACFDPSVPRLPEATGLSASHVGTVTHGVLEKMDFASLSVLGREEGEEAIRGLVEDMIRREFITDEEGRSVKTDKLYEFAVSPLGRRIAQAQKRGSLKREKPFNLSMKVDGEDALVQGIIDCYFEEDGKLILVDYKTTSPSNVKGIRSRYRIQMDIYREALEKALKTEVSESYLYLTNLGLTVDMSR